MKFNTYFNHVRPAGLTFGVSRTQQHFRDECDINNIIRNFEKTGVLVDPFVPRNNYPKFGDFSNIPDYPTAVQAVIDANEAFNELPSRVRRRFNNDPGELIEFLNDENNRDEAISLGLIPKPETIIYPDKDPAPDPGNEDEVTS